MDLIVTPSGCLRCVYAEAIDLDSFGHLNIQRASHVEPDQTGHWIADLSLVHGPVLGPFTRRSEALEAETRWLAANWLSKSITA